MAIEKHFVSVSNDGTLYRLRPDPDWDDGYKSGGVLEWSGGCDKWNDYFHIAPECFEELAKMFSEANEEAVNG